MCDKIVRYPTARRVLILQHPQEQDAVLGSAQILVASLPSAKLVVGLSWRNFAHALGEEGVDPKRWAVLFPERESEGEGDPAEGKPGKSEGKSEGKSGKAEGKPGKASPSVKAEGKAVVVPSELEGLVVLDGTWSKAKTLWWRNPWITKLQRLTLKPAQPSIYGSLRAEPRREYVSTLESVAAALTLCGEPKEIEVGLQRVFRTMVQRVRDAKLIPPPARRPKQRPRAPKPKLPNPGE